MRCQAHHWIGDAILLCTREPGHVGLHWDAPLAWIETNEMDMEVWNDREVGTADFVTSKPRTRKKTS